MTRHSARGFSLLEVLVALTVLAIAGLALVEVTAQGARAAAMAYARERVIVDQDRLLVAYTLLTRAELEGREGSHRVGNYVVRIERLDWALFKVSVGVANQAPDLVTIVYRPTERDGGA